MTKANNFMFKFLFINSAVVLVSLNTYHLPLHYIPFLILNNFLLAIAFLIFLTNLLNSISFRLLDLFLKKLKENDTKIKSSRNGLGFDLQFLIKERINIMLTKRYLVIQGSGYVNSPKGRMIAHLATYIHKLFSIKNIG